MDPGVILIIVGVVVIGIVAVVALRRPKAPQSPADDAVDTERRTLEPPVRDVSLEGDEVVVDFAVPLPQDADERLTRLLMAQAVETVRRRHPELGIDLTSGRLTAVVARAGRTAPEFVGRIELERGELPAAMGQPVIEVEIAEGAAPLLQHAEGGENLGPGSDRADFGPDELPPVGEELALSPEVRTALRAVGVDPGSDDAPEIVEGLLRVAGYAVDRVDDTTYLAKRGGDHVLVRNVPHGSGDHPELEEAAVNSFLVALGSSPVSDGLLVTGKLIPFHLYAKERGGIRLVGRQRLPGFANSLFGS